MAKIGRPRRVDDTPTLPVVVLERVPVDTPTMKQVKGRIEHDVVAKAGDGQVLRRWPWWAADKPRSRRASYMAIDGVRYRVEFAGAAT